MRINDECVWVWNIFNLLLRYYDDVDDDIKNYTKKLSQRCQDQKAYKGKSTLLLLRKVWLLLYYIYLLNTIIIVIYDKNCYKNIRITE